MTPNCYPRAIKKRSSCCPPRPVGPLSKNPRSPFTRGRTYWRKYHNRGKHKDSRLYGTASNPLALPDVTLNAWCLTWLCSSLASTFFSCIQYFSYSNRGILLASTGAHLSSLQKITLRFDYFLCFWFQICPNQCLQKRIPFFSKVRNITILVESVNFRSYQTSSELYCTIQRIYDTNVNPHDTIWCSLFHGKCFSILYIVPSM